LESEQLCLKFQVSSNSVRVYGEVDQLPSSGNNSDNLNSRNGNTSPNNLAYMLWRNGSTNIQTGTFSWDRINFKRPLRFKLTAFDENLDSCDSNQGKISHLDAESQQDVIYSVY